MNTEFAKVECDVVQVPSGTTATQAKTFLNNKTAQGWRVVGAVLDLVILQRIRPAITDR